MIADLIRAHEAHQVALAAHAAAYPFDITTALDVPPLPTASAEAQAGAMIAGYGLIGALRRALAHTLDGSTISAEKQQAYWALALATDELRTAAEAAEAWGVSVRRAQARLAQLGIGWRDAAGEWLVRQQDIDANRPGPVGRPRKQ